MYVSLGAPAGRPDSAALRAAAKNASPSVPISAPPTASMTTSSVGTRCVQT
jgi:hypothetical protein